jgi:hypothetical protein
MIAILAEMTALMVLALALLFTGLEAVEPKAQPLVLVQAIPADYQRCIKVGPPLQKQRRFRNNIPGPNAGSVV